jgi:hypothetical protein
MSRGADPFASSSARPSTANAGGILGIVLKNAERGGCRVVRVLDRSPASVLPPFVLFVWFGLVVCLAWLFAWLGLAWLVLFALHCIVCLVCIALLACFSLASQQANRALVHTLCHIVFIVLIVCLAVHTLHAFFCFMLL